MEEAIIFYCPSLIGHIVSMTKLANLIHHRLHQDHHRRISLTVMYFSDPTEPQTTDAAISQIINSNPSISFLHLPHHPVDTSPTRSRAAIAFEAIRNADPDVSAALRRISSTGTKIRAFVIDMFCGSVLPIAVEQGIPVYHYITFSAACLAVFLHMPTLDRRLGDRVFKDSPELMIDIPGLPEIPANEMPSTVLDSKDPAYKTMIFFCENLKKSNGIVVNTFDELEPVVLEAIASGACVPDGPTPPLFNIGPLIEGIKDNDLRHETLSWLDSQPSQSVVFLCFGSRGRFTTSQMKAIAEGLEKSMQRFIWVVKNPLDDNSNEIDLEKFLPNEFLERTKDIGIVVKGWAPQVAILSHESIGGFVTHCGWNSVLEAVVAGKPMVTWPLYAEQRVNRVVLVKTMGIAISLEHRQGDWFVTGEELASRITELMNSEKGKKVKENSETMRAKALDAQKQGGSSVIALENLVNLWIDE